MKHDSPSLDTELRQLQCSALDDALLARLEGATNGTWTELTREELQFESFLRQTRPAALGHEFLARLEGITRDTHFIINEKIVLFPKEGRSNSARKNYSTWAAAAAVALIGAASALMFPTKDSVKGISRNQTGSSSIAIPASQNFVPAGFNRGLSEVHDEGIVWKQNKQPQRLLRFNYMEKMTYKDANGRSIEVEQPKAHYVLFPEQTD